MTTVPIFRDKVLGDFVPFYLTNRSPMLYAIHTGYVDGYDGGQTSIVYLVTTIDAVISSKARWCFTDGHAVEIFTDFYNSLEGLPNIDWELINGWSWKNTLDDNDRKRRKQAEFLVEQFVPWSWFQRIGVFDLARKRKVEQIIRNESHQPVVNVESSWYY